MTLQEFIPGQHCLARRPACIPSDKRDDQQRVLPSARRLGECIQSAFISGKAVGFAGGLYLSASIKPDSLMPSRMAFLMTRYTSQIVRMNTTVSTAIQKTVSRVISASKACKFILHPSVVRS